MSNFMLLLHERPSDFADLAPSEVQRIITEYSSWREGLMSQGRLTGGQKLKDEGGRVLALNGGEVRVVDGPFAEAKEVMGGFFIIEAADYDEAVEISRTCPHLKYGSRIEVREIDPIHE